MGLLTPDPGLVFWMVIVFGTVFAILAKFGFPVITRMVDARKEYIDNSLQAARDANAQLANIREESDKILMKAHEEQARILKDAKETRIRIVNEAKEQAKIEGDRLMEEIKKQIETEKESAIRDIRRQVAIISVGVAEKVIRQQLADTQEQAKLIDRLLDEALVSSKNIK